MNLGYGVALTRRTGVRLAGGGGQTHLVLTATTNAPSQTVTLQQVKPTGGSIVIDWGDGATTTVNDGVTAAQSRTYAAAGTYTIRISNYVRITTLDLRDSKIGVTINAANQLPTGLTYLYLQSLGGLSWTVGASAPMPTGLTSLYLLSLSGLSWTVGASAPMPTGLTNLYLWSLGGLSWTVGASAPMPTGLTTLSLDNLGGLTPITVWTGINAVRAIRYESSLTQAQVDAVVQAIWQNKANFTYATPSLDLLGGSNAAPSGTYQAASPPTTGKEYIYDLVNGAYTSAGPEWTVQYA